MSLSKLRIISRESPLAMWQANFIRELLLDLHQGLTVEIIAIKTEADKFLGATLSSLGGKGAFVKELEHALLAGYADIAVHSMKDVTIDLPSQLALPIIVTREDPRDVFISNKYVALDALPDGARIGTSSLRRQCQFKTIRPDLELVDIRGNVGTRLKKLDDAQYDALILAAAGVKRLGFEDRVSEYLGVDVVLPAIGQGAIGIETRFDDSAVLELIQPLDDAKTHVCVNAERALSKRLNGGCHAPVAAYAELVDAKLTLKALVGRLDGSEIVRSSVIGIEDEAMELGDKLGHELLDMGADAILQELLDGTVE